MRKAMIVPVCVYLVSRKARYQFHELNRVGDYSKIDVNAASNCCGREPILTDRQTDRAIP